MSGLHLIDQKNSAKRQRQRNGIVDKVDADEETVDGLVGESTGSIRFYQYPGCCRDLIRPYRVSWHPGSPRTYQRN